MERGVPVSVHAKTERLTLREFTTEDVDALYALESLPEVVRFQEYPPRTPEQAREVVEAILSGQTEWPRRHLELAVVREGEFVGRIGAWAEDGAAALWYAFMPHAQGRGLATEAMRAFLPLVAAGRLTIECDPRNVPSWRLAERLGFVRESLTERAFEMKGEWVGSVVYALDSGAERRAHVAEFKAGETREAAWNPTRTTPGSSSA